MASQPSRESSWAISLASIALCLTGVAVVVEAQSWTLTEIVAPSGEGMPVSARGAVAEVFSLGEDSFAFWAGEGSGKWTLYWWRAGTLQKALERRQDLTLPGLEKPVQVVYPTRNDRWAPRQLSDGRKLYLEAFPSAMKRSLLELGAEGLLALLPGRHALPERAGPVEWALPVAIAPGRLLVHYKTGKPSRSAGWALYDGSGFRPFLDEGATLPGQPGVSVESLPGGAATPMGMGNYQWPTLAGEAVLTALDVKGAPYEGALFRVSAGRAEKLIAQGEPAPGDPGRKVNGIARGGMGRTGRIDAASPDTFTVQLGIGVGRRIEEYPVYLYHRSSFRRMIGTAEIRRLPGVAKDALLDASRAYFLSEEPLRALLFVALTSMRTSPPRWSSGFMMSEKTISIDVRCFYLDEQGVRPIVEPTRWGLRQPEGPIPLDERALDLRIQPAGAGYAGLILGFPVRSVAWREGADGAAVEAPPGWLFDQSAPDRFAEPPTIETSKGPVSLAHVVAWLSNERGVVVRDGGLYLLDRRTTGP